MRCSGGCTHAARAAALLRQPARLAAQEAIMLARTFGRVAVLLFLATVPGAADAQSEVALDSLFKLGVGLADQYFRQEGDRQVRQATPDQGHATHYSASDVR